MAVSGFWSVQEVGFRETPLEVVCELEKSVEFRHRTERCLSGGGNDVRSEGVVY